MMPFLLPFLFFFVGNVHSQGIHHHHNSVHQLSFNNHTNYTNSHNIFCGFDNLQPTVPSQEQQLQEQLEQELKEMIERGYPSSNGRLLYTLPVVVHVVHNGVVGNIPNAQVTAAIQQLNNAYANVGVYNAAMGIDVEVQFCLAQRDPNGNATNGITNTISPLTNLDMNTQDLALKSLVRWNPLDYINIYVVNDIQGSVAGYAYLPSSHGNNVDGIVLEAAYMGTSPNDTKVLVHEMGHYLGLYHTFQGGCANNNCLTDGDRVCDTPPDNTTAWVPCAAVVNSCTTDDDDLSVNNPFRPIANGGLGDQLDQKENYMDYSNFICYDRFTQGQKTRMHFFITGIRASLLASMGCIAPCTTPINIGFTASSTTVIAGTNVNFTNTTIGATSYNWYQNGTSFATTTNSNYLFNTIGTFSIVLQAMNGNPNCTVFDTINITVTCAAQASFTSSNTQISPNDVVIFTNTSTGATNYQWFVNNALQGTNTNFNFTFPLVGTYDVFLVATDGICTDTSATTIITVATSNLAQTGLPVWPLAVSGNVIPQAVDWRDTIPSISNIANLTTNGGQTGAAFNECGQLAFFALHTGSANPNELFIYAADGTPLLTNTTPNAPGLNAVKGGQEIQVVKVPQTNDEWFIIYKMWATDAGAIGGNGAYTPANWLFSRVRYTGGNTLTVLQRDIALLDGGGVARTYTDGAAVSRTAGGVAGQHFLYLCRRTTNVNNISLDRFLITNAGIAFSANTGNVNATWWGLTIAGSPIELSPTEDRIAVTCRNESVNFTDIVIFDAALFNAASAQPISLGDLILQPDGTPIDQSSVLNIAGAVEVIALNGTYPLGFLRNLERKVSNIEFSPNGRFLYFTSGGYVAGGVTNITYLGQIDLNAAPYEVRLQVQTVPSGLDMTTGAGCSFATCPNYQSTLAIESCYDGNLYFTKSSSSTLFVIPNPNNFMPQNLVPSNISLATAAEPNINILAGVPSALPDQIDGFNYLANQFTEVEILVQRLDCNGICDTASYALEIVDSSGVVVESFLITDCPDTIRFCADTSLIYALRNTTGVNYPFAIYYGQVLYPAGDSLFDFGPIAGCNEICTNGIDDDGDGLIDIFDPDCPCTNPVCNEPTYNICNTCQFLPPAATSWQLQTVWESQRNIGANTLTPVVGDVDGDCIPDVIYSDNDSIIVLDGATGFTKFVIFNNLRIARSVAGNIAIADVDADGLTDIFAITETNNPVGQRQCLVRYEFNGVSGFNQIFLATNPVGPYTNYDPNFGQRYQFLAINIADINYDNRPEISIGNEIFDAINGDLITSGGVGNPMGAQVAWTGATNIGKISSATNLVDILPDSFCPNCDGLELVTGNAIYSIDIPVGSGAGLGSMNIEVTNPTIQDGFSSVADLDFDGQLDVVSTWANGPTSSYMITAWNALTGATYSQFIRTGLNAIGPGRVAIADLDNAVPRDLEIAFHVQPGLYTYKFNPVTHTFSLLASIAVSDPSRTSVGVFDFDGNGANEVVYRDENVLRVLSGNTLTNLVAPSIGCISATDLEYPIIVDANGDGQTEILISCGNKMKLYGNGSVGQVWMPSRKVWNQFSYFNTNINDDLTVPHHQQAQQIVGDSLMLNSYLKQYGNPTFPVPDATVSINSVLCGQDSITLVLNVCNTGSNTLSSQTPIAIYNANPSVSATAIPIAPVYSLGQNLEKDSCYTLNLKASNLYSTFYVVVNDDTSVPPAYNFNVDFPVTTIPECNFLNNIDSIVFVPTAPSLNLGSDTTLCENGIIELNAGSGFATYLWQNGSVDSTLTADSSGVYWVEAITICGDTLRDSILITIDPIGLITIADTTICSGDSLHLSFSNLLTYQWFPNQSISCTNCATPSFFPTTTTTYIGVVNNDIGCFSVDSFTITIGTCTNYTTWDTSICMGDVLVYAGNNLLPNTIDTFQLGVDSFLIVTVTGLDTFNITIDTTACLGSTLAFGGQFLQPNTTTVFNFQTINGCDSIVTINIVGVDTFNIVIDTTVCLGNTLAFGGQFLQANTSTTFNLQTMNGCDSIITVNVSGLPTYAITIDTAICTGTTFAFGGQFLQPNTTTVFNLQTTNGCDSIITVNVSGLPAYTTIIDTFICFGTSIVFGGLTLQPNSSTAFNYQTINGCDSIITVNVFGLNNYNIVIDTNICLGNNLVWGGQVLATNTTTVFNLQTIYGCDSIVTVNVIGLDTFNIIIDTIICQGTSLFYNNQFLPIGSTTTFNFQTINGCDSMVTVNVYSFPISFTVSRTNVSCFSGNNGTATINASGGLGGFTYFWNSTQTTPISTGLVAGFHCVTATDGIGCMVDTCIQVFEPSALSLSFSNIVNVSCFGGNNGRATVTATGGTQPYFYSWSNGENTPTASALNANNHGVTITDANGCTIVGNVTITQPTALQLSFTMDTVNCRGGNDGRLTANVSGGTFPYTYLWNAATGNQVTATATGLVAGNYTVTATDFNGCRIIGSSPMLQPSAPLTASIISTTNPSCNNSCDGIIEVDAQGATPNYTFQWSNGQNTSIATGVCAGVHRVTITDANGCSTTASGILTQPSAIILNPSILSNYNGSPITCPGAADGSVGVVAAGGNGGFSYIWSPNGQNTANINGLVEGTYCVTVTDVRGCKADTCITINDPTPLQANFTQVNILCHGDANGQILVNAVTGTGTIGINGYEYKLTGPGQVGNVYSNVNAYSNLVAGAYTIFVRDGNDCEIQIPVQITEPAEVVVTAVNVTNALCYGSATGTATAVVTGGTGAYTYIWSNSQTTNPATGLALGLYTVTVADANGCNKVETFNVGQAPELIGSVTATPVACLGGVSTATATASGGTPINLNSYLYRWTNGTTNATAVNLSAGVHCVTITDANACTIVECVTITEPATAVSATISSQTAALCQGTATGTATAQGVGGTAPYSYVWQTLPNQSTQTATGLQTGIYAVVVTDDNGCTSQTNVTITEPNSVSVSIVGIGGATCNGLANGTATAVGAGGVGGFTYNWNNGETTATATGLAAGNNTVTITDANGCSTTAIAVITQPTAVEITNLSTTDVACFGDATGTAALSVQGGTPTNGYIYNWSSGVSQNGVTVSGLSAGSHTVTVTDANGCYDIDTFVINQPATGLTGYLTGTPALCFGTSSGQMGAVVQGGTPYPNGSYVYEWNTNPAQSTVVADSIPAGTYTVTVTDFNTCSIVLTGTIGQAPQLNITATVQQPVTCNGGNNGIAIATTATGGTPGYTYVWTDAAGQVGQVATGLSAGVVSVVVTDANGCSASAAVTVTEGAPIALNANITNVSCHGGNNGGINITNPNITIVGYAWSNGMVGNPINNLTAGAYTVTVTANNGCKEEFTYTVTEPATMGLELAQTNEILCYGDNDGEIQASLTGGTPNYSYAWSNGMSGATISNLGPGAYAVTVTDANGCRTNASITITQPAMLTVVGVPTGTLCAGDNTGRIAAYGTGGTLTTGFLQYSIDGQNWSGGNLFAGLTAGIYNLQVQDQNGCIADTAVVIQDADPFFITSLTADTTIEYLDTMQVFAMVNDTTGVDFTWYDISNGGGLITNSSYDFTIAPEEPITYQFTATNANGCEVDSIVIIEVEKPRRANAPLAFTPNGDGANDYFFIQGDDKVGTVSLFRIYDRWGELVFEGQNLDVNVAEQGWNGVYKGQPCTSGAYTWYADVLFKDGETIQIKGDVTLLR